MQEQKLAVACLAVDGTRLTPAIVDLAIQLKTMGVLRKIVVSHVHNHRKTYMPRSLKMQGIREYLMSILPASADVIYELKPLEEGKTSHETILATHHIRKCELLFLGFYGAKGKKRRQEDLCSKIRKFVFQSKLSLVLVKQQHKIREKPTIIFCYDGSEIAYEGLLDIIQICQVMKSRLIVVHAHSTDTEKFTNILHHQMRQLKKISKDIDIELKILQTADETPREALLSYLHKQQDSVDFIALTKNGQRGSLSNKTFVGETAYNIIVGTDINLILLK